MVKLLLHRGADVNPQTRRRHDRSRVHYPDKHAQTRRGDVHAQTRSKDEKYKKQNTSNDAQTGRQESEQEDAQQGPMGKDAASHDAQSVGHGAMKRFHDAHTGSRDAQIESRDAQTETDGGDTPLHIALSQVGAELISYTRHCIDTVSVFHCENLRLSVAGSRGGSRALVQSGR